MSPIANDELDAILADVKEMWAALIDVARMVPGSANIVEPRRQLPEVVAMVFEQAKVVSSETAATAEKVMDRIIQANAVELDEQARNVLKAAVVGVGVGPATLHHDKLGKEPINLGELRDFGARHGSLGRDETSARIGKAADRIEWLERELAILKASNEGMFQRLAPGVEYVEGTGVGYGEDEIDRLQRQIDTLKAQQSATTPTLEREPKMRLEGCRHSLQRMVEWIDSGACPICATATAGALREELATAGSHPYCARCKGPAMSIGGCKSDDCPVAKR